jgi:hypothetical protein
MHKHLKVRCLTPRLTRTRALLTVLLKLSVAAGVSSTFSRLSWKLVLPVSRSWVSHKEKENTSGKLARLAGS